MIATKNRDEIDERTSRFEERALGQLDALFNRALDWCGSESEAADTVVEVYLRARRGVEGRNPTGFSKAWLFGILFSILTKERGWSVSAYGFRENGSRAAASDDVDAGVRDHVFESNGIRQALESLPGELRLPLVLVDSDQLTHEGAAKVMRTSVSAVRTRLHDARRALVRISKISNAGESDCRWMAGADVLGSGRGDRLQDFVEKRLDANVRREVEAHLDLCETCRDECETFFRVREALMEVPVVPAPPELRARVKGSLKRERAEVAFYSTAADSHSSRVPVTLASIVLAGLVAFLGYFTFGKDPELTELIARDLREVRDGESKLSIETSDTNTLTAYFEGRGIAFPVRMLDLKPQGFALKGGATRESGSRTRTLVAHRGAGGAIVLSESFFGSVAELPEGAAVHTNRGIRFHVFSKSGSSLVFWQDGPLVRVLAADLSPDRLAEIAFTQASF